MGTVSPLHRHRTPASIPCSTPVLAAAWATRLSNDGHRVTDVTGCLVTVATGGTLQEVMDLARAAFAGGYAVAEDLDAVMQHHVHASLDRSVPRFDTRAA